MLTELRLANFKAFGEMQRIPIKPLTLIFGGNSSGKSSILHSLLLVNHASENGDFDVRLPRIAGRGVDLGGFRSYVHAHDETRTADYYLEAVIDHNRLRQEMPGANEKEKSAFARFSRFGLKLTCSLSHSQNGTVLLRKIEVAIDGEPVLLFKLTEAAVYRAEVMHGCLDCLHDIVREILASIAWKERGPEFDPYPLALHDSDKAEHARRLAEFQRAKDAHGRSHVPSETELAGFRETFAVVMAEDTFALEGIVLHDPRPKGIRTWPSGMGQLLSGDHGGVAGAFHQLGGLIGADSPLRAEAHALRFNLSSLIQTCSRSLSEVIAGMRYLGPLREVPSRHFTESVGEERVIGTPEQSWWRLTRDEALVADVNRWLRDRLQTRYECQMRKLLDDTGVERGVFPEFFDTHNRISLSHRDLGFGISQVLPVLAEAAANKNRLIAVEQPELHLHPAQQAELGDVFIESALGERKNTFLLETHSEHLILRIMRRIRETHSKSLPGGCTPVTQRDVSVLYVEPEGARSIIREMPLNNRGDLFKAWPGGFFEEGYRELFG